MACFHLWVTDRPTLTTPFLYSLHLNNSVDILFSTFLLTDPEVFLMLLHNSVWCCIATVLVSLYVTGEGGFSGGRTGGSDWWCWCQCFSAGWLVWVARFWWRWLQDWTDVDSWMMDWWIARRMFWWLMSGWKQEGWDGGKEAEQKRRESVGVEDLKLNTVVLI